MEEAFIQVEIQVNLSPIPAVMLLTIFSFLGLILQTRRLEAAGSQPILEN